MRRAGGVAERHADSREQLAGAERFAHVVVGARVERRDLVALLTARRQHDHGHGGPFAYATDHVQAIHVGQAEVDDDDVRLTGADLDHAIGSGRRLEEPIALPLERGPEEFADLGLVLDDDDDRVRHPRARRRAPCRRAAA